MDIGSNKKIYIVSDFISQKETNGDNDTDIDNQRESLNSAFSPFCELIQSELGRYKINSEIIQIDDALNRDLSDIAGLIIAYPNHAFDNDDNSCKGNPAYFDISDISGAKSFLKKSFLAAKKYGRNLTENNSLFATISFLGGSFGFDDQNISDPLQGGLAGLAKTAALEWSGVLCRAIDFPSNLQLQNSISKTQESTSQFKNSTSEPQDSISQFKESVKTAVSLILTRYSDDSSLNGAVEIGVKDRFCLIPELTPQDVKSSLTADQKSNLEEQLFNLEELGEFNRDVVVITGGARGVTAECAVELAKRFSPTIVLLGRTEILKSEPEWLSKAETEAEIKKAVLANFSQYRSSKSCDSQVICNSKNLPTPLEIQKTSKNIMADREIRQNLERIASAGSVVEYYSVDIRNFEDVEKTLHDVRKKFGRITAVVHGAGTLEDKLIVDKTEAQFSAVFETKVAGIENLLKAAADDKLKYVIFFSSVAARGGNTGQVDYAMANEVLNKLAQYYSKSSGINQSDNKYNKSDERADSALKYNKCRFLSINWGPWEGGMVSPSLKNAFIKRGIDLIPLKEGAESFVDEICMNLSKTGEKAGLSNVELVIGASLFNDSQFSKNSGKIELSETKQHAEPNDKKYSTPQPVLFSKEQILECAVGSPSKAFGEKYREFDTKRQMARLPGPPYCFMDRIIKIDAKQWEMAPSGWIEAQFDMPYDGWYFRAGHTDYLPFSILLEIALQPCGWLASYSGSALHSKDRLFFRNLGGEAQIFQPVKRVKPDFETTKYSGTAKNSMSYNNLHTTLTMRSKMTSVSQAGGMIIQNFLMEVLIGNNCVYKGKTNFGFFTAQAFANQTGITNSSLMDYSVTYNENSYDNTFFNKAEIRIDAKKCYGMPSKPLLMIDTIDLILHDGGKYGKGFIKAVKKVDPEEWFFKAHFYQDPVCPGSLGVESFLQAVKFYALKTWNYDSDKYDLVMASHSHKWTYRGQIIQSCKNIEIYAHIKDIADYSNNAVIDSNENGKSLNTGGKRTGEKNKNSRITADGLLYVDGLCIYQMEDFSMELVERS